MKAFAEHNKLNESIRFETEVTKVHKEDGQWLVHSTKGGAESVDKFDAVCVANGQYEVAQKPTLKGQDVFPGKIEHSHDYKLPTNYTGQRVVVLGASFSGEDISRDMSSEIEKGWLVARKPGVCMPDTSPIGPNGNVERKCGTIEELKADGSVVLSNGDVLDNITTVMLCTGYSYNYKILDVPKLEWNATSVGPLYQHQFFAHDPSLIFIGVPTLIAHFPMVELQALWAAQQLAGNFEKAMLPDEEGMLKYWENWKEARKDLGPAMFQAFNMYQWPFANMLRDITGTARLDPPCWRQHLWLKSLCTLAVNDNFRNDPIEGTEICLVSEDTADVIM